MNITLEDFYEDVFYESIGLENLLFLERSLRKLLLYERHLVEIRNPEQEQQNFENLINDVRTKATAVWATNIPVDKVQERFKNVEKLIFSIIGQLKALNADVENINIAQVCKDSLNHFLDRLRVDFVAADIELYHSFVIGNRTKVVESDFNYNVYEDAYNKRLHNRGIHLKRKCGIEPKDTTYEIVPEYINGEH